MCRNRAIQFLFTLVDMANVSSTIFELGECHVYDNATKVHHNTCDRRYKGDL